MNVDDVDAAYTEARRRGYEIVYPLTEEPWGHSALLRPRPEASSSTWSVTPTDSPAAVVPLPDPGDNADQESRSPVTEPAPSMTAMDITIHSTFKRLRLVRRTEVLRNG